MIKSQASFAAYFNVARHNLLLCLNDIARKSGLPSIENDDQIANHPVLSQLQAWAQTEEAGALISDKDIRRVKPLVKGLQKAMPILGDDFIQAISGQKISLDYKRPPRTASQPGDPVQWKNLNTEKPIRTWRLGDLHWVLEMLTKTLMAQRNFHSHAHQHTVGLAPPLVNLLGTWFDTGRREVKSRFEYHEQDVEHLIRLDEITKKEDPNAPHALTYRERGSQVLSLRGTAFFCCLFLDKQQGNGFLKQITGFRNDLDRPHQASLRTYLHWSIRLPFVRIDTDSTTQSLALDMLNELARCPAEIYDEMGAAEQKNFEIHAEAQDAWPTHDEEGEGLATRFIRHSDRFAPLMMECLDHLASANPSLDTGIRFQLDLGDFYFAAYPKKLPDGSTEVRRLKQKVLRFGALPSALQQAKTKPDAWRALERINTERDYDQPFIVPSRPHYHLHSMGSLPIQLKKVHSTELYAAPQRDSARPDRFTPLASERPDFWLSPYELVNLAFYQHLRVQHHLPESEYPQVDNLLRMYQSTLQRLYAHMHANPVFWQSPDPTALNEKLANFGRTSGQTAGQDKSPAKVYTLRSQDLPEDLQRLLLGQNRAPALLVHQQAQNTVDLLLTEGQARWVQVQRVKQVLSERIKPGKPSHRVLRAGVMATYLAKDILRFQPVQDEHTAHKGKPTSIMADLLQARLAFFGRDKTSLPALFNSLGLTGNPEVHKNHPFLHRIRVDAPGMNGIAQFYEAYLQQRQTHLKSLQSLLETGPASLQSPDLAWLHLAQTPQRLQGKGGVPELTQSYLKRMRDLEPLNLPRGLFRALTVRALLSLNEPLRMALQTELDKEPLRGRFTSPSTLVALYFAHVQGDASQDFYYSDTVKLQNRFDALNSADWRKATWAVHFEKHWRTEHRQASGRDLEEALRTERQRRLKNLSKHQHALNRTLNHRATQDQVLFLAARQLIDLNETGKKVTQSAAQAFDVPLLAKVKLQTLTRDRLNDSVAHAVHLLGKTIYLDEVKVKNIGQFKNLLRDRRLPGLLHYYPSDRIHASVVAHELQAYPRAQKQAFEDVLAFEQMANARQKWQADDPALKTQGSLHRVLLTQHLQKASVSPEQKETLQAEALTLRNAFCHNQTPAPDPTQEPLAQPMLAAAHAQLTAVRQSAQNIEAIQGGRSVAQHFASALRERYALLKGQAPERSKIQ